MAAAAEVVAVAELGIGIGWRDELDLSIARLPGVDWVEVVAENLHAEHLPETLETLRQLHGCS